jgi:NYN domain
MRVGVYIDGYNLYYGGRKQLGKVPGWRWLDLRALADTLVGEQRSWNGASVDRIVYCTARIDQGLNPVGHIEQDVYLKALLATGSVDHIEYGKYVKGIRHRPLAVLGPAPDRSPLIVNADWPVKVQAPLGAPVHNAVFMVSTLHHEEKGTDVNVATHLLIDILERRVDAVVLVSNDSDLKLSVRNARDRVPVGLVNPYGRYFAGDLTGRPSDGVGGHWWRKLVPPDFRRHQLGDPAGIYSRPVGW